MKRYFCLVLCLMMVFMAVPGNAQTTDGQDMPQMTICIVDNASRVVPYEEMPMLKQLEEQTGISFKWMVIPEEGAGEKLNLMLASGDELPDIFWNGISTSTVNQYINEGIFMPTDELIEKYVPNLVSIFEKYPHYKMQTVYPDGHMYGFPYIEECPGNATMFPGPFIINVDWLEKVGKEMPKTLDEFKNVLIAFRDAGDLNGNGKADEIPFSNNFTGNGDYLGSFNAFFRIMGCFGDGVDYNNSFPYCKVSDEGKVYMATTGEAFKNTLKFFHELYKENLLDLDGFAVGNTTPKLAQDEAVIGAICAWAPYNLFHNDEVFAQYQPLPALEGENGKMGFVLNFSPLQNSRFLITTDCDYPEIAAAFVNACYEPANSIMVNAGVLDYQYFYNEDGLLDSMVKKQPERFAKIEVAGHTFENDNQMRWNTTPGQGPVAVLDEYTGVITAESEPTSVDTWYTWQAPQGRDEFFAEEMDNALIPMMLSAEAQEKYDLIAPVVQDAVKAYMVDSVMNGNVDETWDAYLTNLNAAGLEELIGVIQDAYDAIH